MKLPISIHLQPFAVLATSELQGTSAPEPLPGDPAPFYIERLDPSLPGPLVATSSQIVRTTFSSIPVIWQSELGQEYQELGDALGQLTEVNQGDEWGVEPLVYGAACFIAAGLMVNSFPAPRVFNHGPKSVVFNWSCAANNLYLTISADRISALISSPERIQKRIEFSAADLLNPTLLLSTIQSAHPDQPIPMRLNGALPDPPELVG
jgi:hypothetical protein